MSLADLVRNAVTLANSLTTSLQCTVTHTPWAGSDGYGADTPGQPVNRKAIVERDSKLLKLPNGRLVQIFATVTFLEPVTDNGAQFRVEPIDPRDTIQLPDGSTAPIVHVTHGLVDPGTNRPYLYTVILGSIVG